MLTLFLFSLLFLISMLVLHRSSDMVVRNSVKITKTLKISELFIGFLIIAFTTSVPEIAVSFSSIISHQIEIAVGNILGSNITNICLILGLGILLAPRDIKLGEKEFRTMTSILFFFSLLLLLFLIPGMRYVLGAVFLLSYLPLAMHVWGKKTRMSGRKRKKKIIREVCWLSLGLILLLISSRAVVDTASILATELGITESFIGSTLIALGTSLPELSITLQALKKGHGKLGVGNVIGSCLTNFSLILGPILLLSSAQVEMNMFVSLIFFSLLSSLVLWYMLEDGKLKVVEGAILVMIYLVFLLSISGLQLTLMVLS